MRLWSFYGDKQEFPTGTLNAVAGIAGDAMTGALDAAEFLDIDVYQSSRFVVFVAHDGLRGLADTPRLVAMCACVRRSGATPLSPTRCPH